MSLLTAVSAHPHLRSSLTQPRLPLGPQPRSPCSWSLVPGTSGGGQCSPSSRKAPVETSSGGSSHTSSRSGVRKSILQGELREDESTLPTQLLGSPFLTCHPSVSHHPPSSPGNLASGLISASDERAHRRLARSEEHSPAKPAQPAGRREHRRASSLQDLASWTGPAKPRPQPDTGSAKWVAPGREPRRGPAPASWGLGA